MELTLEDGTVRQIHASGELRPLLETLNDEDNTFAILAKAEEDFIQTSRDSSGFVVETRRGSASEHFAAARTSSPSAPPPGDTWWGSRKRTDHELFDLEETISLFAAWIEGREPPPLIQWVRMDI
jgi:hypothetical protein